MFAEYAVLTPVEDLLPDESGLYYCRLKNGEFTTLHFHKRRIRSYWTDAMDRNVTAQVDAWEVLPWRRGEP